MNNPNSHPGQMPSCYVVFVGLTTFADNEPESLLEVTFNSPDSEEARKAANQYVVDKTRELKAAGSYLGRPFKNIQDFVLGKDAFFYIKLVHLGFVAGRDLDFSMPDVDSIEDVDEALKQKYLDFIEKRSEMVLQRERQIALQRLQNPDIITKN